MDFPYDYANYISTKYVSEIVPENSLFTFIFLFVCPQSPQSLIVQRLIVAKLFAQMEPFLCLQPDLAVQFVQVRVFFSDREKSFEKAFERASWTD